MASENAAPVTAPSSDQERVALHRSRDLAITVVLFILQAAISFVAILLSVALGFISASCTGRDCNSDLITSSGVLILAATFLVMVGSLVLATVRRRTHHNTWWIPLLGIGVVIVCFFVSWSLLAIGTHHPFGDFFAPN